MLCAWTAWRDRASMPREWEVNFFPTLDHTYNHCWKASRIGVFHASSVGHQSRLYDEKGRVYVARTRRRHAPRCGRGLLGPLKRDEDVSIRVSSALVPSRRSLPRNQDLDTFCLFRVVTASNIFFWSSDVMIRCTHGKPLPSRLYQRDRARCQGQKMSKSKGNTLDP